ncbi:MAG: DUF4203 domain-containing protein [Deltaproteobacteria bacterium]
MEPLAQILLGCVVLIAGRRLFWLFVGIAGFLFGMQFAVILFGTVSSFHRLVFAFALGLIGALGAVSTQWFTVLLAGFLGGGYVAFWMGRYLMGLPDASLMFVLAGGAAGAVLLALFFNPALIALSSLFGAALIVDAAAPPAPFDVLLLGVLTGAGIFIQSRRPRGAGCRRAGCAKGKDSAG